MIAVPAVRKPRCFLVHALAPTGLRAVTANAQFNAYVANPARGLSLWHDHFIGVPGGTAIFFVEDEAERAALSQTDPLEDWELQIHPLIFSYSPSALDEQMAYTLRAYRGADWQALKQEQRPQYGNLQREAETAEES
jgi:hypothetical protein